MKFLSFTCFLILLFSCSQEKKKNVSYPIQNKLSGIKFSHFEQVFKAKEQVFQWNTNKDTLLTLEKGTKIFLPKGCVDLIEKNKSVQVKVKECYDISDFIAEKLTTISDKGILETGGMVHVDIDQNGTDLELKKGAEYQIYFPKNGVQKSDMKTFYGSKVENDKIVWNEGKETTSSKVNINLFDVEGAPEIDTSLIDSTTCKINVSLRVTYIGYNEVKWKINNTNEYFPDFVDKNFKPSEQMRKDFCENLFETEYDLKYNSEGKIIDVKVIKSSTKEYDSIFIQFLKNAPNIDMTSMPKMFDDYYSLGISWSNSYHYDKEEYTEKFRNKYLNFYDKPISAVNKAELNYYVLNVTKLGWINCDRFWETKDEKIDFIVNSSEELNLNLVFDDIKSIMPATKKGNSYIFQNVPINRKIKLLGIKFGEGNVQLATSKTVISRNTFALNNFKDFTLTELEKELNGN